MTIDIEHMYRMLDLYGAAVDPRDDVYEIAALMPGDRVYARGPIGGDWDNTNTQFGDWPAHAPENGDLSDLLFQLWHPTLTYDSDSSATDELIVRQITRQWNPTQGWQITIGGDPLSELNYNSADALALDGSGSY